VVQEPQKPTSTKLIVDFMCGKLARWLRVLGVDTEYYKGTDSTNLLKRALSQQRTVVTRNTRISRIPNVRILVLDSELPDEQIKQVVRDLHLEDRLAPFTRCNMCNGELTDMKKSDAKGKVPFYVFQTQDRFKTCARCGRIYWEGTHIQSMRDYITKLLEQNKG